MIEHNLNEHKAVLLLFAIENEAGIFHFPVFNGDFPGIYVETGARLPLVDFFKKKLSLLLGPEYIKDKDEFHPHVMGQVQWKSEEIIPLFVGKSSSQWSKVPPNWSPIPNLLSNMPKNRNRLPYVKCWQIIMGTHKDHISAKEIKKKHPLLI